MKKNDFDALMASVREAGDIKKGVVPPSRQFNFSPLDIKKVRQSLKVSQSVFSRMIGVTISTLQNWEQGRRSPNGPARALLTVAEKNPDAVYKALHG